jgi:rod shape-determining protein MreD
VRDGLSTKHSGSRAYSKAISPSLAATARRNNDPLTTGIDGRWVWGTIAVTFLISLLPWRAIPYAPDLLLLVIAFWCVHDSQRVGLVTAFCLGLLIDVQSVAPLGQHALTYVLVCFGGLLIGRRLQRFDLLRQTLHMMPIFIVGISITILLVAALKDFWPGWGWAISALFTAVLWVPFGWLLQMPINRLASQSLGQG